MKILFSEIFVPEAVFTEFMVKADKEDEKKFREVIKIAEVKDSLAVMALQSDLGRGESECIVISKEINANFVVLDDKDARKMAEFLGLNVIGTLGLLVMVHKKGKIQNVKRIVDKMREENFWIDEKLYKRIMEEIE